MSDSDETTINIAPLEALVKAFTRPAPTIRVGILGAKDSRNSTSAKGSTSNASIGAAHEFGTSKLPQRSFLRVPLTNNLSGEIQKSGIGEKQHLQEVLRSGSLLPWAIELATIAEGVVDDAFETGGDGKWKRSNMKHKEVQQTLVETSQLRRSITSEVKES